MVYPSIVVVICTYNNANLLELTLSSISQQQITPDLEWSVLVVDNNSTDETQTVVTHYQQLGNIPKLRLVNESKQGLGYARIRAVREASSELIAFVDDDCLLSLHWVQQAVLFCRDHPKAGAVGGKVELLWEIPPPEIVLRQKAIFAEQDYGILPCQMPSTGYTYLVGAGLVVRRSALLASGWLDGMALVGRQEKMLTAGDDSEIVLRIRNAGYELWYNSAMQLQHYIRRERISVEYLCRVSRGGGRSKPFLKALGNCIKPTFTVRLQFLVAGFKYMIRVLLSIAYRDSLRLCPVSPERQIYLSGALGNIEGTIHFFMRGYKEL